MMFCACESLCSIYPLKLGDISRIAEVSFVSSLGQSLIAESWWDLCECQAEFGYVLGPCCVST